MIALVLIALIWISVEVVEDHVTQRADNRLQVLVEKPVTLFRNPSPISVSENPRVGVITQSGLYDVTEYKITKENDTSLHAFKIHVDTDLVGYAIAWNDNFKFKRRSEQNWATVDNEGQLISSRQPER